MKKISKLQCLERKLHQPWLVFMWVLNVLVELEFAVVVLSRKENRKTRRKTLGARQEPTVNKLNQCKTAS